MNLAETYTLIHMQAINEKTPHPGVKICTLPIPANPITHKRVLKNENEGG